MIEIKQRLIDFSNFLEENEKELRKAEYCSCLEDIYGQVTEIVDNSEINWNLGFNGESIMDNEDD
jgi:hypothetical protein